MDYLIREHCSLIILFQLFFLREDQIVFGFFTKPCLNFLQKKKKNRCWLCARWGHWSIQSAFEERQTWRAYVSIQQKVSSSTKRFSLKVKERRTTHLGSERNSRAQSSIVFCSLQGAWQEWKKRHKEQASTRSDFALLFISMLSKGSARTVGLCKTMKSSKDIFLCFSMINVTKDDPRSDKTSWISVAPTSHLSLSLSRPYWIRIPLDSHPPRCLDKMCLSN